jgi:probable HAF family extracellular repeat protein
MKKWNILAMVFVLNALFCLAGSGAAYSGGVMVDLGTLPGGWSSEATGINDKGQIVGMSSTTIGSNGYSRAFLYSGGKMKDLGILAGTTDSGATGINSNGQIVGWSSAGVGKIYYAVLYSGDTKTDLGTPAGYTSSSATGINNNGQIVGITFTTSVTRAVLYSGGTTVLPSTFGGTDSQANGINNDGKIVGYADTASTYHAFLKNPGEAMQDLTTLPGGTWSNAKAINNIGQIVGVSEIAGGWYRAFLKNPVGAMQNLGTLPGGNWSQATAINDKGQIVGYADTASGKFHAFLYSGGKMTDLGTLGGDYSQASGINNNGQIVGIADTAGGSSHAFLYNPASHSLPAIQSLLIGDWLTPIIFPIVPLDWLAGGDVEGRMHLAFPAYGSSRIKSGRQMSSRRAGKHRASRLLHHCLSRRQPFSSTAHSQVIPTAANAMVKAWIRPIRHPRHVTVLYPIGVDVINLRLIVTLAAPTMGTANPPIFVGVVVADWFSRLEGSRKERGWAQPLWKKIL